MEIVIVAILLLVLLLCLIYEDIQYKKEAQTWIERRMEPERKQYEAFLAEFSIHKKILEEFLEKKKLPWRIAEVDCSKDPIYYSPSCDGVMFDEPWKIMDWLELGGVNKDGEKQYVASLRETFHGWYVVFYFRRIRGE